MASENGWMPETIGAPPTILYWEVDKLVLPFILLGLGIFSGFLFLCLGLVIVYFFVLAKYEEKLPKGFNINVLYILGVLPIKTCPSFFSKVFEE